MIRDGARNEPGNPRQVSGSGLMFIDGSVIERNPIVHIQLLVASKVVQEGLSV